MWLQILLQVRFEEIISGKLCHIHEVYQTKNMFLCLFVHTEHRGSPLPVGFNKWSRTQRMTRTQWVVKGSTGGQGLNSWPRTQRVVNPFSGNLEDEKDGL